MSSAAPSSLPSCLPLPVATCGMTELTALEVLSVLHAGPGAVVTFHRKGQDGKFQDVASLGADELGDKLPFVAAHLKRDSYFSINSTYRQRHSRVSPVTNLPVYSRREERLRWLNAVAVDLDAGHHLEEFSFHTLCASFLAEINESGLPSPSLICSSGRGMWALWILQDYRVHGRVPAHDRCRQWAKRIGQAITRRFAHLSADLRCHDCARIMRFPGSRNSKASPGSDVVRFFRVCNREYTLPDLGPHFGVRPRKTSLVALKGPRDAAKQAAAFARWGNVLAGFRHLWALRGGFRKGARRNAVYVLAILLRYNRISADAITCECFKLADSCKPPLAAEEVTKRISAAAKVHARLRHDTFVRLLGITSAEIDQLPIWFKPYRQSARQRIEKRRQVLVKAIKTAQRFFSVREAVLVLRSKGFPVSVGTACLDLRAIGPRVQKSLLDSNSPLLQVQAQKIEHLQNWDFGSVPSAAGGARKQLVGANSHSELVVPVSPLSMVTKRANSPRSFDLPEPVRALPLRKKKARQ